MILVRPNLLEPYDLPTKCGRRSRRQYARSNRKMGGVKSRLPATACVPHQRVGLLLGHGVCEIPK